MKFFLRFGHLLVLFLILLLALICVNELGYLDKWKTSDIEVEFIKSDVDYDSDGVDDYTDILNGARSFIAMNRAAQKSRSKHYRDKYHSAKRSLHLCPNDIRADNLRYKNYFYHHKSPQPFLR